MKVYIVWEIEEWQGVISRFIKRVFLKEEDAEQYKDYLEATQDEFFAFAVNSKDVF
jgi:hypothetical protein